MDIDDSMHCYRHYHLGWLGWMSVHLHLYDYRYSQPHLIGTWLIGSSGSDQDFTPDNHCYDRQVACLSVITMAYQVRNLDHFLNSQLTRFRLSGVDCIMFCFIAYPPLWL